MARTERDVTDERTGLTKVEPEPVPDWLDYEMWLGPAPSAPYTTARLAYPHWFHISDYSLGYVSGWGIHHIDIAQWANGTGLTGPLESPAQQCGRMMTPFATTRQAGTSITIMPME